MVLETKIVLIIGVGGVGCLLLGALVWYLMHQRQEMEKRLLAMRQLRTAQAHLKLQQQQQLQLQQQQQQPDFRFHSPDLRGVQVRQTFNVFFSLRKVVAYWYRGHIFVHYTKLWHF